MKKAFVGVRLKRLREERGLTQLALAEALALSPSYVNQLEKNQRPLTVPVLLRINEVFGIDVQLFSEGDEARLLSDLRDVFAEPGGGDQISLADLREVASSMPGLGRAIVALHGRWRNAMDLNDGMALQLGVGSGGIAATAPMHFEQVRDFFYRNNNYFDDLDQAAESLSREVRFAPREMADGFARLLHSRHDVRVVKTDDGEVQRKFSRSEGLLFLSRRLDDGQQAFQIATQLAFLEQGPLIESLAEKAASGAGETHALARIGLANYFAGAVLMPYGEFLAAAATERYDLDRLSQRFGVGYETVCHRVSTLQRSGARGVPFFFIRVDRAGNISKRQSATGFHFSRVGGTCPLWNVYEAFAQPGRILTQVATMPDGRTYLWIARTVSRPGGGYGRPEQTFAIGLGCDVQHAERLVYSRGLDLADRSAAIPIGMGCKICERPDCAQRAFPPVGRPLVVDEQVTGLVPYATIT